MQREKKGIARKIIMTALPVALKIMGMIVEETRLHNSHYNRPLVIPPGNQWAFFKHKE